MKISVIAKCVPAILIVCGFVTYWMGDIGFGLAAIITGAVLQALYIIGKYYM